jgi:hypothetical protein
MTTLNATTTLNAMRNAPQHLGPPDGAVETDSKKTLTTRRKQSIH